MLMLYPYRLNNAHEAGITSSMACYWVIDKCVNIWLIDDNVLLSIVFRYNYVTITCFKRNV